MVRLHQNWIAGALEASEKELTIEVLNPSSEEVIGLIPKGCHRDANKVAMVAKKASKDWAEKKPAERRNILREFVAKIETHKEAIATLLAKENGKPLSQALGEMDVAIDVARSFTELILHLRSGQQMSGVNELNFQYRVPRGVAACIIPWNFPIAVGIENIVPNLLVGNTVVWKPSEKTPLSTIYILEKCGYLLPSGVLNVLLGDGLVGDALVRDENVDLVVFVGSEATGRHIGQLCGNSLKKVILELGGKDPAIVDETVDIKKAASLVATASYAAAGQICTSLERVYVAKEVLEDFTLEIIQISKNINLGDPFLKTTNMGPLVDDTQLQKVVNQVEDARIKGGKILTGGKQLAGKGFYYTPTVIAGVTNNMILMQEETFGPIIPLIPFDNFDEAINEANNCPFGLACMVFTTSAPRAIQALQQIKAGMIKINTMRGKAPGGTSEPFGASGLGCGYGLEFLYEITCQKSVHWQSAL